MNRRTLLLSSTAGMSAVSGCLSGFTTERDEIGDVTVGENYDERSIDIIEPDGPAIAHDSNLVEYTLIEETTLTGSETIVAKNNAETTEALDDLIWVYVVGSRIPSRIEDDHIEILDGYLADTEGWDAFAETVEEASERFSSIIVNSSALDVLTNLRAELESQNHIISPFRELVEFLHELGVFDEYIETVEEFEAFVDLIGSLEGQISDVADGGTTFRHGSDEWNSHYETVGLVDGIQSLAAFQDNPAIDWAYVGRHYFPRGSLNAATRREGVQMQNLPNYYYPSPGEFDLLEDLPIGPQLPLTRANLDGGLVGDLASLLEPLRHLSGLFQELSTQASQLARSLQGIELPGSSKTAVVCGLLATLCSELGAQTAQYLDPLLEVFRAFTEIHYFLNTGFESISVSE